MGRRTSLRKVSVALAVCLSLAGCIQRLGEQKSRIKQRCSGGDEACDRGTDDVEVAQRGRQCLLDIVKGQEVSTGLPFQKLWGEVDGWSTAESIRLRIEGRTIRVHRDVTDIGIVDMPIGYGGRSQSTVGFRWNLHGVSYPIVFAPKGGLGAVRDCLSVVIAEATNRIDDEDVSRALQNAASEVVSVSDAQLFRMAFSTDAKAILTREGSSLQETLVAVMAQRCQSQIIGEGWTYVYGNEDMAVYYSQPHNGMGFVAVVFSEDGELLGSFLVPSLKVTSLWGMLRTAASAEGRME